MMLLCENCERGIEIPSWHKCTVTCSCGAKYTVDPEHLAYDRVAGPTVASPLAATIFADIDVELSRANTKYAPTFNSLNEALGTITAEYTELSAEIIAHSPSERIREEAIQVAAMAVKLVQYLDSKYGGDPKCRG